ncbi:flavin reductase (DIM6/NTAB) family NADH-FMN oxidoreductase RutF [Flavobacterium sp. 103]|uniref:flavin reductase family protein n=1 Tax=unclassified Flavobacterium TaxID=196869 RepID=UPI000D5DCF50|nr:MULTISPECIES: flavin reductase [unclassified Flavobacterium]PVX46369.1 flavin reductase (DIM6/NTAB) family NADH-FMN oxidoreductase RutF [Flavobacterium sp. 103]QKJ65038.1 flavin reductase [Flavobacterium sp. M31R6]
MKNISKETISQMDKIEKLNLINSCTGFKSANLIATKSIEGNTNVAIFSSVTHLGSSPSLIGFIVRPTTVPRDTYKNIMETGYFTVNHITVDMIADAHHTSANYDSGISEFDKTNLEEEYKEGFNIPFVKGSPVQLYCKYVNEYIIKENDTIHIIASIEHIFFDETLEHKDGWLQLDKGNIVALNGVDGYFLPKLIDRFQYAQQNVPTKSFKKDKE